MLNIPNRVNETLCCPFTQQRFHADILKHFSHQKKAPGMFHSHSRAKRTSGWGGSTCCPFRYKIPSWKQTRKWRGMQIPNGQFRCKFDSNLSLLTTCLVHSLLFPLLIFHFRYVWWANTTTFCTLHCESVGSGVCEIQPLLMYYSVSAEMFALKVQCTVIIIFVCFASYMHFRGNLFLWEDFREIIFGSSVWSECTAFHSRMAKRFQGPGNEHFI